MIFTQEARFPPETAATGHWPRRGAPLYYCRQSTAGQGSLFQRVAPVEAKTLPTPTKSGRATAGGRHPLLSDGGRSLAPSGDASGDSAVRRTLFSGFPDKGCAQETGQPPAGVRRPPSSRRHQCSSPLSPLSPPPSRRAPAAPVPALRPPSLLPSRPPSQARSRPPRCDLTHFQRYVRPDAFRRARGSTGCGSCRLAPSLLVPLPLDWARPAHLLFWATNVANLFSGPTCRQGLSPYLGVAASKNHPDMDRYQPRRKRAGGFRLLGLAERGHGPRRFCLRRERGHPQGRQGLEGPPYPVLASHVIGCSEQRHVNLRQRHVNLRAWTARLTRLPKYVFPAPAAGHRLWQEAAVRQVSANVA